MKVYTYSVDDHTRITTEGVYTFEDHPELKKLDAHQVEKRRRRRTFLAIGLLVFTILAALLFAGSVTAGIMLTSKHSEFHSIFWHPLALLTL